MADIVDPATPLMANYGDERAAHLSTGRQLSHRMLPVYCPSKAVILIAVALLGGFLVVATLVPEFAELWSSVREKTRTRFVSAVGGMMGTSFSADKINAEMRNFYANYGYSVEGVMDSKWGHLAVLKSAKELNCSVAFGDWKTLTSKSGSKGGPAPSRLEPVDEFTLGGRAPSFDCYYDQTDYFGGQTPEWTEAFIEEGMANISRDPFAPNAYAYYDASGIYLATRKYSIDGKVGAVIGTKTPWVEVYCLINGAELLITVDYAKIKMGHPRMVFLHAFDLVKLRAVYSNSFDFVVSFSSIEHSGLGRYGDPLNPWGDVEEVQKVRCLLKPGGHFFLGVPVGKDRTGFNCHRFYGRWRLPLLMIGFELIDVFSRDPEPIPSLSDGILSAEQRPDDPHFVFVLRKT